MLSMNSLNCAGGKSSKAVQNKLPHGELCFAKLTREAVEVDSSEQLEESGTMLRILSKVLINHVQCWFKYRIKNGGHVRR